MKAFSILRSDLFPGQAFQDAKNENVGYLAFLAALVASYL
jgi:hypothetical protein